MLIGLDLRQLIEDRLRQFALFQIEKMIVTQKESAVILVFGFLDSEVFIAPLRVFDLPENYDRALLAFAYMPAKFSSVMSLN